ncbi:MAG: hypothetical protein NWE88_10605 [Candidatus Bathyarchaeota archaeon]|nr:hypothetical protein [Candidatus Bathyarchaeota archaeon]
MFEDATPEREEELIEQAAQYIVRHDLEDFAQIALEGTAPFGDIVGELGFMMTYPLAVTFFNRTGSDFINMLGFNYKLNAEKILKRIEELKKVKELQEKHFKEQEKFKRKLKGAPEGWFARQLWRLGFKRKK